MNVFLIQAGCHRDNYTDVGIFKDPEQVRSIVERCKRSVTMEISKFEECKEKVSSWEKNIVSRTLIIYPDYYEILVTEFILGKEIIP